MKWIKASVVAIPLLAALWACSSSDASFQLGQEDAALAVAVAAAEADGADTATGHLGVEPLLVRGCGFESIIGQLLERFDADDSGELSAEEQDAIAAELGTSTDRLALLSSIYDSDSSGSLDATELAAVQADIEARCEAREAALLAQFDADGDGALSDTELQAARDTLAPSIGRDRGRGRKGGARRERTERVEREFDRDGDGKLGGAEHAAFGKHMRGCVRGEHPMDPGDVPAVPEDAPEPTAPTEPEPTAPTEPEPTPPTDPEPTPPADPEPTPPADPEPTPDAPGEPGTTPDAGASELR